MYYTDSVIEESTVQKLLWHLLPLLCLLSMAATLNRFSLGYAAGSLGPALGASAGQLAFANNLFCVGYVLASLPAAWFLLRHGARRWLTAMVLTCGALAIGHAMVWNVASLYALHLLLGAAEAGLLPGMMFYLTLWMPPRHRAKAITALVAAAWLVPLFAAEASALLLLLGRWFAISDWRWMFVVEGLPTLWIGLHVAGRMPQAPAEARWLPASERQWLLDQLRGAVPPGAAIRFADGLRSTPMWRLAAALGIVGLVSGNLGMWVPLAMQQVGYVPPGAGAAIMATASVLGVVVAVVAGLALTGRAQCRRGLAVCLALAGVCLGTAAVLPYGIVAVLMLAVIACVAPAIAVLAWVLAPCVLTGAAAAAGFAVLGVAGMVGSFAAGGLAVMQLDVGGRCLLLAAACLAVAWLVRGLDGRHPAKLPASAASPGE